MRYESLRNPVQMPGTLFSFPYSCILCRNIIYGQSEKVWEKT